MDDFGKLAGMRDEESVRETMKRTAAYLRAAEGTLADVRETHFTDRLTDTNPYREQRQRATQHARREADLIETGIVGVRNELAEMETIKASNDDFLRRAEAAHVAALELRERATAVSENIDSRLGNPKAAAYNRNINAMAADRRGAAAAAAAAAVDDGITMHE